MSSQKTFIETNLREISERLDRIPRLGTSDQTTEFEKLETLISSVENENAKFTSLVSASQGDAFEEKLNMLKNRLEELKAPMGARASSTTFALSRGTKGPTFLQKAAKVGNHVLAEQKNATRRILTVVNQMNDEISGIEKEIWVQREKLLLTRDRVNRSQAFVAQTKRALSFFAKTLYQDKLIKGLIVLIALAVFGVIISSLLYSSKKTRIEFQEKNSKKVDHQNKFADMNDEIFEKAFRDRRGGVGRHQKTIGESTFESSDFHSSLPSVMSQIPHDHKNNHLNEISGQKKNEKLKTFKPIIELEEEADQNAPLNDDNGLDKQVVAEQKEVLVSGQHIEDIV